MIIVIEDISGLIKEDNYHYINDYYEYVLVYKLIQEAIQKKDDLNVIVRKSVVITWLKKLSNRYEDHIFNFEKVTYKTNLQSQWGINIPDEYDPDDLEKLELATLDAYPKPTDNFEGFILNYFYDPLFSNHVFTQNSIVPFIKAFDKKKWEENDNSNLLRKIYSMKINDWKERIKDENLLSTLDGILLNPEIVFEELMKYKVLRTQLYNEIGKLILREKFEIYNRLNINLKELEINFEKIHQTVKQVEIHLNTLKLPTNEKELEDRINSLSGLLPVEFYHVENILKEHPELISKTLIGQIKTIFSTIYSMVGKKIEKLNDLIVPEKPELITDNWELNKVKEWLTKRYFPYYDWLLRNNKYDSDFLNIGDSFSLWLYENWEDVKNNSKSLVSNWLYNNSSSFNKSDKINIILIIDNLSWTHSELLQNFFLEKNLQQISIEPYFSMIPSETETSKKCLLSGKPSYTDIDQKTYTDILNKGWVPFFNSSNFIYVPNLDKFEKMNLEKGNSYFVNYHSIDIILHQEQAKLGLTHDKQTKNLLAELTERISNYLNETNISSDVIIHIISDHGSTKLHSETKNDLDVKLFKKKRTIKISERFVFFNDEEFSALPDNLQYDAFFLDRNRFGLPNNCLAARRGNTFKDYSFNSYLHGGLLPEEVVIPHLIFEKVEVKIDNPIITLLRNKFRYKIEEIEIQIENPNILALENLQLTILNSNIELLPKSIEWINAKSKETLRLQARIKKSNNPNEQKYFTILVKYFANRKPYEFEQRKEIKMVSMVELKDTTVFDI